MATGYTLSNGVDLADVFAPRTSSPSPGVGLRDISGNDLAALFEPRLNGADIGYDTGYRKVDGTDLRHVFAAKGTTLSTLSINGQNYYANNQARGSARVRFQTLADGSFRVFMISSNNGTENVVDSGFWLPSGDNAGLYTVQYAVTQSGSTVGNGTNGPGNSTSNGASSQVGVGNQPSVWAESKAITTTDRAESHGDMTIQFFRQGVLRVSGRISYGTNVNGN